MVGVLVCGVVGIVVGVCVLVVGVLVFWVWVFMFDMVRNRVEVVRKVWIVCLLVMVSFFLYGLCSGLEFDNVDVLLVFICCYFDDMFCNMCVLLYGGVVLCLLVGIWLGVIVFVCGCCCVVVWVDDIVVLVGRFVICVDLSGCNG